MSKFVKENIDVDVLGSIYSIKYVPYNSDPFFIANKAIGLCDMYAKEILICDNDTLPSEMKYVNKAVIPAYKETLRHELMHAFLYESGLSACTADCEGWATNEEMIDWLAIQWPKINKIFKNLNILD